MDEVIVFAIGVFFPFGIFAFIATNILYAVLLTFISLSIIFFSYKTYKKNATRNFLAHLLYSKNFLKPRFFERNCYSDDAEKIKLTEEKQIIPAGYETRYKD